MILKEFRNKIEDMTFYYVDDFYVNKEKIRDKYETLPNDEKQIYKWYFFYQLCFVKAKIKSIFWDYVNGKANDVEVEKEYEAYCKRREDLGSYARNRALNTNI